MLDKITFNAFEPGARCRADTHHSANQTAIWFAKNRYAICAIYGLFYLFSLSIRHLFILLIEILHCPAEDHSIKSVYSLYLLSHPLPFLYRFSFPCAQRMSIHPSPHGKVHCCFWSRTEKTSPNPSSSAKFLAENGWPRYYLFLHRAHHPIITSKSSLLGDWSRRVPPGLHF